MPSLTLQHVTSVAEFASYATPWNDLWQRSTVRHPACRAEGILLWMRHFAAEHGFSAILAQRDGRLLAGLPLVHYSRAGVPFVGLPVNQWGHAGGLLIDDRCDVDLAMDDLVEALVNTDSYMLCFEEISLNAPHWQAFRHALARAGKPQGIVRENIVGVIDTGNDWHAYLAKWNKKKRRSIRRFERKLWAEGEVTVDRHRAWTARISHLMQTAFELEHRSWKGEAGTSVLSNPGVAEYYVQEAELMAQQGFLDLWFLKLADIPIAFAYCHQAKDACLCHKIGYDPAFRQFAPGKLLRRFQLEEFHHDTKISQFDTLGTLCPAIAEVATRTYRTGCLLGSLGGPISNLVLKSVLKTRPLVRMLRRPEVTDVVPQLEPPSCFGDSTSASRG